MPRLATFSRVTSRFTFDPRLQRYRGPGGRLVPARQIKRALNTVAAAARREIKSLGRQLAVGDIEIGDFQQQMAGTLKNLHLAEYAAGRGGFGGLTQSDYGRVGARLRFHYGRLNRFALEVESGAQRVGGIENRSGMYASAGNATFEESRRVSAKSTGFDQARRVLGNGEHCDDCVSYAADGWQPIDAVPDIGDSVCRVNCLCSLEFRRSEDADDEE